MINFIKIETKSSVLGFKAYFGNWLLQTPLKIKINPDLSTPFSFWFRVFRAQDKLLKSTDTIQGGISENLSLIPMPILQSKSIQNYFCLLALNLQETS